MRRWTGIILVFLAIGGLGWSMPSANAAPSHVGDPCVKVRASIGPHHAHVGDTLVIGASYSGCGRSVYIHHLPGIRPNVRPDEQSVPFGDGSEDRPGTAW